MNEEWASSCDAVFQVNIEQMREYLILVEDGCAEDIKNFFHAHCVDYENYEQELEELCIESQ